MKRKTLLGSNGLAPIVSDGPFAAGFSNEDQLRHNLGGTGIGQVVEGMDANRVWPTCW